MTDRRIRWSKVLGQSASARAVLGLTALMVAVIAIFVTGLLMDLRAREIDHAQGEIVSLSRILGEQTSRSMDGVASTMRGVRDRLLDETGARLAFDHPALTALLRARAAGLPQLQALFIVDAQGRVASASRPEVMRSLTLADAQYFRHFVHDHGDALYVGTSSVTPIDGAWTYNLALRLSGDDGQLRGVLVAAIDVAYLQSVYDSISLDTVSRIHLLDRAGGVLVGEPREGRGPDASGAHATRLSTAYPEAGLSLVTENAARGVRHVAYREVASYPLTIAVGVDEVDALAPWRQVAGPIAGAALVIVAVLLGVSAFTLRNLARKATLEAALKERDEQLRLMVQSIGDAIVTMNTEQRIVLFNRAAEHLLGVRAEDVVGRPIREVLSRCVPAEALPRVLACFEIAPGATSAAALPCTIQLMCAERALVVELGLATTMFRGAMLLTAVFRDLTERQRAERDLQESNRQLQALSAALQHVREQERARIARELHDELGQLLTGIRMEVSWLGGRLSAEHHGLVGKIASIKGQIDQTIHSVRRIASELRPLVLDDLGFCAAAKWYVDQFAARTGLQVQLDLPGCDPQQGGAVGTALFRVLQEALTNIARHAQAHRVDIRLARGAQAWTLSIRDDGAGMAPGAAQRSGFGIVSMRERVQILGGQFALTSTCTAGTSIVVDIPLEIERDDIDAQIPSVVG